MSVAKIVGTLQVGEQVVDLSLVHGVYKDRGGTGYWIRKWINGTVVKDYYPSILPAQRSIIHSACNFNQTVHMYGVRDDSE